MNAPGGLFDRLQQALDNRAQVQGTLEGLAPALRQSGVPVSAPQGLFSSFMSKFGLGSPDQPQQAAATPTPVAAQPATGASSAGGVMPIFRNAIASIESDGSGGYKAQGPMTDTGDRGLGRYQVMASNVGPWSKEILGLSQGLTRKQFLDNPDLQDAIFDGKFAQYLRQTGNPRDAASMWFTGKPYAQGADRQDQLGTTGAGYVAKFMAALPRGGSQDQQSAPVQLAQNGVDDASDVAPSAAHPYAYAQNGAGVAGATSKVPFPGSQPPAAPPSQAAAVAASNATGPDGGAAPASPSQVIAPLMANPATRGIGAQLWRGSLQQAGGKLPGSLPLPAGMTPEALATMISTPQTQAMGLAIWQRALFPQITSIEPGRAIFAGTQYVGQSPSAPMTVKTGEAVVNPNSGATIAAVPPDLQHAEIGRDAYGQPQYGAFNPRGGAVAPFPAGQGAAATATGPDGQPLSGDAFLGTLPPALANQVRAIADGRMKAPSGMGANSPMAQRIRAAVLQYDPSFDQAGVDARFETRADFAKGDAAKTITAGNTALIHLGELSDLIDKLGNVDTSIPGNNAVNWVKNQSNASSAAGAPLAAFNATASKYVEEATKFYRGTGGTEADISRDMLTISPNMSPTQLKAAIGAQIPLIAGKIAALQDRWHQGMGAKAGDYPIMSPQAQAVYSRLAPQPQPGDAAAANLPTAAPAGAQGAGTIPTLTDPSQLQALPPGTRFRTPDGQLRVKH